jgi:biofilm PGA synthesis protein PgaA
MNNKKSVDKFWIFALLGCTAIQGHTNVANIQELREQSIVAIRQGQANKGIDQLRQLLSQYPNEQKLIADYIVVTHQQQQFTVEDHKYLNNIELGNFPEYAWLHLIKALRDQQKFELAQHWTKQFYQKSTDQKWLVWQGILHAEAGDLKVAQSILKSINSSNFTIDYLSLLSYGYRIGGMPIEALATAKKALSIQKNTETQELYILALMVNSDYAKIYQYLQDQQLLNMRPNLKSLVNINEFSARIQQLVQVQREIDDPELEQRNRNALRRVVLEMQTFEPQLPEDIELRRLFYYDHSYALNALQESQQVLNTLAKVSIPISDMPTYVRHVAAESYLRLRQPKQAEVYYRSVVKDSKSANYDVYAGLYYALIEQEKFDQAHDLIEQMDRLLPRFRYSDAKGINPEIHSERATYLSLKGLNYAYRNEHDKAEKYFQKLVEHAPNNNAYINNLAMVQRWREKPRQASWTVSQLNGIEPMDFGTELNHMQNAQALDNIQLWKHALDDLIQRAPLDTGVQRSQRELNERDHWSIQHQSYIAKTRSDDRDLLGRLIGSGEHDHFTRLNTPWLNDHYRIYMIHQQRLADYDDGKVDDQRLELGLEWSSKHKYASFNLSQSLEDDRLGVAMNWSHTLNDHWYYTTNFNSQAYIPLQAIKRGNEGQSYALGVHWQQHESRKAGISTQIIDIDDGNLRQEYSAYFKQRIYQSPHHLTDLRLFTYFGQNEQVEVDYFNPETHYSAELTLLHDWLTWRNYAQHFNQHFEVTLGLYKQDGYTQKANYNLFYQHEWQFTPTWSLNYGVGWGIHPYDGEDERKTYGVIGFKGHF